MILRLLILRILSAIPLAPFVLTACSSLEGAGGADSASMAVPRGQAQAVGEPHDGLRSPPVPRPRPRDPQVSSRQADSHISNSRDSADDAITPLPKLVGLSADQTEELLGHPSEKDELPPGKIWTYRGGGCVLVVHLFPDMEKGGFYALDYTSEGNADNREACLARTAESRRRISGERAALPGSL